MATAFKKATKLVEAEDFDLSKDVSSE